VLVAASFEISAFARKHAPWSYSKMELAETCPAQFRHKHIAKTTAAPAPSDTKVGIVAHAVLEHRVMGKPSGIAKKTAVEKTPLTTTEQEMLHMLEENMEDFLRRFDNFCKAQGVTKVMCEADWGFTDDYKPTGFFAENVFFRGKLDLGALTRDNDLFLIDHKSGEAKPLERDQKKRQQLQAYGVLALPNMPDIAGVRGGIHFMQGNPDERLQWTTYIPAERIRALYMPWLFGRINTSAENLAEPFEARPAKSLMKKNNKPGWPCGWCQYQDVCPEFKEKFGGS
jgi:RecB family exonuclease